MDKKEMMMEALMEWDDSREQDIICDVLEYMKLNPSVDIINNLDPGDWFAPEDLNCDADFIWADEILMNAKEFLEEWTG